jgi:hypothetical protein
MSVELISIVVCSVNILSVSPSWFSIGAIKKGRRTNNET